MSRAWQVVALAFVISGCGYALAGKGNTLPAYIKTIGVPPFQNLSTTPELDRMITDAVVVELQKRGKYSVVSETDGVDAILTGALQSVTPTAINFTDAQQVSKYNVTVVARAEFKETKDNKITYSDTIRVTDEYDVVGGLAGGDLATVFTQDRNALTRLAKSFATSLVSSILEKF
jgi:PBP1b-binding outer membrane lipoprotein LpoB